MKTIRTGKFRVRVGAFGKLILQIQEEHSWLGRHLVTEVTKIYRDAIIEDLTEFKIEVVK
uniref:Uncharacterized protein n=1 Tax=viral metagenome TaxID=1070528 RepID=A0A6M3LQG8_9ZZZZ